MAEVSDHRPRGARWVGLSLVAIGLALLPRFGNPFLVVLATSLYIQIIGVLGLNLLTGNTGLISLGYSAFLAIGAYTNAILQLDLGISAVLSIPAAGLAAAAVGLLIGLPSLRLKGLYLAITTLALAIIVNVLIVEGGSLTRGSEGIVVPPLTLLGLPFANAASLNWLCLILCVVFLIATVNLERSHVGRAFMALRESEVAAGASGIFVTRYKLIAFMISSFYIGVSGALFAHFIGYLNVDSFNPTLGIEALAMIITGGLGSALGSVLGVVVLVVLAETLRLLIASSGGVLAALLPTATAGLELRGFVFGAAIILFLRFQPDGVAGMWRAMECVARRWRANPGRSEAIHETGP